MKRKHVYMLLAAPILAVLILLLVLPSSTRQMFLYEFKHNVGGLLGYEAVPVKGADGSTGLRSEHPEEYGGAAPQEGEENAVSE